MTLVDRAVDGYETRSDSAAALAALEGALAALEGVDLDALGDDALSEFVLAHQRLRGRLDANEARALARWDAKRCWRPSGARTGAQWLAWKERVPIQVARQRLRHARALRALPAIGEAWAAGEIDRAHVTTLLGVRNPRTEAEFDDEHDELVDAARTSGFVVFKRRCEYWVQRVDLDGAEQDAALAREGREAHLSQTIGGMWFGRLALDPVSGEIVHTSLSEIERELFDADWAAAKERVGRNPSLAELDRTPGQRRADALVEMATRARTAPDGGRRPAPLFSVLVGYETFAGPICELANRTVVTPGQLVGHLTEAEIERIVFDGPSRVTGVGAKRRFFRGADRRAIEVRDRTCFHPSCDEPPERPQIDHITEASRGGPTVQANGRLGCGFHNRWRNTHPDHEWPEPGRDDRSDGRGPDPPVP